jgi:hypothetical protein
VLAHLDLVGAVPDDVGVPVNAAAAPRSDGLAKSTRSIARAVRRAGRPELVGHIKSNRLVTRTLYRERPTAAPDPLDGTDVDALRDFFAPSVARLGRLIGDDLLTVWDYPR